MEVIVGEKTLNINNEHWPLVEELIPVCKGLIGSVYIAAILCKQKEMDTESSPLVYSESDVVAEVISALYFSICRASNTVIDMNTLRKGSTIHAIPLARGVIETCINASFIMANGENGAQSAIDHAIAKSFRGFDRSSGKGSHCIKVSRQPPISLNKKLRSVLDKFSNKKGRPKDWTDLRVPQRIDVIKETFGTKVAIGLNSAYLNIYQDASEMIHGSYLGSLLSQGREPFSIPAMNMNEIYDKNERAYSYSLCAMFQSIHATLISFAHFTNVDKKHFLLDEHYTKFAEVVMGESVDKYRS